MEQDLDFSLLYCFIDNSQCYQLKGGTLEERDSGLPFPTDSSYLDGVMEQAGLWAMGMVTD